MALPQLASDEQLDRYMSSYGVIAFADHDNDGTADPNVVNDCKTYGNAFLIQKLAQRYTAEQLANAPIVSEIAAIIILRELCLRRGNAPPASLEYRYEEITKTGGIIDLVARGREMLVDETGALLRPNIASPPAVANLQIDRRFPENTVRVVSGSSSNRPTKVKRDVDVSNEVI